jgi:large subunit ribosomal protein L9
MKVVILKHYPSLGKVGDIKDVAEGYAHNFLFPQKIAALATDGNISHARALKQKKDEAKNRHVVDPEKLVTGLRTMSITLKERADEKGTFFAGITKEKIIEELKTQGIHLKAKQLVLDQPIKKPGSYSIPVNVEAGNQTKFTLNAQGV